MPKGYYCTPKIGDTFPRFYGVDQYGETVDLYDFSKIENQMQLDNFENFEREKPSGILDDWINTKLDLAIEKTNEALNDYRFDLATQSIYDFIW